MIKLPFAAIAIVCACISLAELISVRRFESWVELTKDPKIKNQIVSPPAIDQFLAADDLTKVALFYSDLGEMQQSPTERLNYLCATTFFIEQSLSKEPYNARNLVTWASLRQLLNDYNCNTIGWHTSTNKDYKAALSFAVDRDPQDQQAIFNAGLVYLWAGDRVRAYELFNRVLSLGTDTSELQRNFIYSLVNDSESLKALVPARIPQGLEFLKFYDAGSISDSKLKRLSESDVEDFQVKIIDEYSHRYQAGEIEPDLYAMRLNELWLVNKNFKVSNLLDGLLASYYDQVGIAELRDYFASRAKYSEIVVVPAYRLADSRPEKSSIYNWGAEVRFSFDEFYNSLGFYLPRNSTLRRIELHSDFKGLALSSGLIRVFASDDNFSWEDQTGFANFGMAKLDSGSVIYIDLPGSTKKFWKVHFASPQRTSQFRGNLHSVLRVLGIGGK